MTVARDVEAFLEQERLAIRSGRFDDLPGLLERKEKLLAQFADTHPEKDTLTRLKEKSERNASLLEAARRGFAAALTQVGQAQAAASPRTYGPKGERDALGPHVNRVEKRC